MVSIHMVISDPWLSEMLHCLSYRVTLEDESFSEGDKRKLLEFLERSSTSNIFVYCKVPTSLPKSAHFLESLGFRLIDTSATFERELLPNPRFSKHTSVQFAVPEDEGSVVEIARKSFKYSRFHLDPLIGNDMANHVKGEWVRNYFLGKRGKWLVTSKIEGTCAGFLLLIKDGSKILTIDLIGVAQEHQKKGIAQSMISFAESHCEDVRRIRVGTQIANTPSINLYEKMGFHLVDTHYVFHYHNIPTNLS